MRRQVVLLLPVRNGEGDLPGFFKSVAPFADAVVALDDGSTDSTREVLSGEPLVRVLLTNPVRPTYVGWDDSRNRGRLLEAAAGLNPAWILSLDHDERIEASDGLALVEFIRTEALRGVAYGLEMHRMLGGGLCYDKRGLWNYRLFAYDPSYRFPGRRHHFQPVPVGLPLSRRVRTTIRIQHLAGTDVGRRRARFEKYRQVDPGNEYQGSYENLLEEPVCRRLWVCRPAGLAVAVDPARHAAMGGRGGRGGGGGEPIGGRGARS